MYKNWEETITIPKFDWYPVSILVKFLHDLRDHIVSNDSAKVLPFKISSLEKTPLPASRNERFPENDAYLCEGIGDLTEKLDRLHLTINVLMNPQRLERKYMEYKTVGEVEMYILKSINQLLCELELKSDMIITREAFESRHRLFWMDSTTTTASAPNSSNTHASSSSSSTTTTGFQNPASDENQVRRGITTK